MHNKKDMKKLILFLTLCILSLNLFSQTYKLETVISDKVTETYLSYWRGLQSTSEQKIDTFSLWGYQLYSDDWSSGAYEVQYFKGDAAGMYGFLSNIVEFSKKYKKEDNVVTYINGVQVKTMNRASFKYTLVYDKERKVVCKFKAKQWEDIFNQFVSFCDKEQIKRE